MQSPLPTKHHRRSTKVQLFRRLLMLTIGAIIFALGLKGFLVPNNIIDGGIVGISIIGSKVTDTTLALWLFFLNIPFIFFGYKQIGKTFALST
ncbi:YitT family protein, partial [Exiguobacterium sp.]